MKHLFSSVVMILFLGLFSSAHALEFNTNHSPMVVSEAVELPLHQQQNSNIVVPVTLNHHGKSTFILDTGASVTVISHKLAKQLGIPINETTRKVKIQTANGQIEVPEITIDTLTIQGVEVHHVSAIVQDVSNNQTIDGLLGMNILTGLELSTTSNKLVLYINMAN